MSDCNAKHNVMITKHVAFHITMPALELVVSVEYHLPRHSAFAAGMLGIAMIPFVTPLEGDQQHNAGFDSPGGLR